MDRGFRATSGYTYVICQKTILNIWDQSQKVEEGVLGALEHISPEPAHFWNFLGLFSPGANPSTNPMLASKLGHAISLLGKNRNTVREKYSAEEMH